MIKKDYRPFRISCGLHEGYEQSNKTHTISEAREIISQWIEGRLRDTKKILVGTLFKGEYIYPLTKENAITTGCEPAFYYQGVVREDASSEDALEMLEDLARTLSSTLGQERVHVLWCSEYFVIETTVEK